MITKITRRCKLKSCRKIIKKPTSIQLYCNQDCRQKDYYNKNKNQLTKEFIDLSLKCSICKEEAKGLFHQKSYCKYHFELAQRNQKSKQNERKKKDRRDLQGN